MGGHVQLDLSYATILVNGIEVRIDREPRSSCIIEEVDPAQMTCFFHMDMDNFHISIAKPTMSNTKQIEMHAKENKNMIWQMYFDGTCSKDGNGVGVVFISPNGKSFKYSFLLAFECTNNIAEYEDLLLGLRIANAHGIKMLIVYGDSELIISQVKNKFATNNSKLRHYWNEIWDSIEFFDAFAINWTERSKNILADFMANLAIKHNDIPFDEITQVEVKTRLTVPDNIKKWKFFYDDRDLLKFLICEDQYEDQKIDLTTYVENQDGKDTLFGKEILQLKSNKIPKGLVVLERIFDNQDRADLKSNPVTQEDIEKINLGSEHNPREVFIGKRLTPKIRTALIIF